jgi:membrane-associated phospholipid phosphatase
MNNSSKIVVKSLSEKYLTRKNLLFISLGVLFILFFFFFTLQVRSDNLRSFDFDTTVRLQNITPVRVDSFFSFLSVVGRFEYTTAVLAIFLLIWSKLKFKRLIRAGIILGLFIFAHILELIGKTILEQPGPPNMFLRSQFSEFPGLHVYTDASYPSGHSLRVVFLGIIYAYSIFRTKFPLGAKIFLYLMLAGTAFAMLYSRVSLGEHWTTDVIGGTLLGVGVALISLVLL